MLNCTFVFSTTVLFHWEYLFALCIFHCGQIDLHFLSTFLGIMELIPCFHGLGVYPVCRSLSPNFEITSAVCMSSCRHLRCVVCIPGILLCSPPFFSMTCSIFSHPFYLKIFSILTLIKSYQSLMPSSIPSSGS